MTQRQCFSPPISDTPGYRFTAANNASDTSRSLAGRRQPHHVERHSLWAPLVDTMTDDVSHPEAPQRSDTAATIEPLTEQEYQELQGQLGDGSLARLIQPDTSQRSHEQWFQHQSSDMLAALDHRSDTLDRNPGFVDPHQVTDHQEQINGQNDDDVKPPPAVKVEDNPTTVIRPNNFITLMTETHWNIQPDDPQQLPAAPIPTFNVSSPTCANPSPQPWPGDLDFNMRFLQVSQGSKNKSWDFSQNLNKLFIDMGKVVQVAFYAGENPPDGLFIRAVPVYTVPTFLRDPVKRCPNHSSLSDASNKGFPEEFVEHLIRIQHDAAVYEKDATSGRLSVLVPFERPQAGTRYCAHLLKFMCLGSDVGGINRRAVKVIFTLEQGPGDVLGRTAVDVRICSCPKRDRQQEEAKHKALVLADGLARSNSVLSKPSAKKRKGDSEEFVMVPVAKADFEKINEFAEAAVVMRNLEKSSLIRAERKRLLDMHNKKYFNKATK